MEVQNQKIELLEDVHRLLTGSFALAANEPSFGLHLIQQHNQLVKKSRDSELATADAKDCIECIHTIKKCGPPAIASMIKALSLANLEIAAIQQPSRAISILSASARPRLVLLKSITYLGLRNSENGPKHYQLDNKQIVELHNEEESEKLDVDATQNVTD